MVEVEKHRMPGESAFLAFATEVLDCADFLAIPANHLQLIEATFAITVDPGLGPVHLRERL
jgi:hypothetical protein